ncbi:hypothetical protein FA13DRAFT_1812550 [Coprinellus micaceus]|uniref:Uncharacterized protein n=1 Tax=Coprinellus micaceus TaxID=71717 RepID=A0A4Y7TIF3_COPMI|nr:hypothetical protein FA13DRAFT_1812550 [Coprinellus micaceus]
MSATPHRRDPFDDEEDESLFGSPPPSPGRSPSPALALPGTSNAIPSVITKNVGTIALPGSQSHSELLNPLASSLSLPHTRLPPPPSSVASSDASLPPTPSTSSTVLPKAPRARKRKKRLAPESTPRPELHIPLPEPGAPPPANFLRSQTALLGAAGLVAGVKPANLVHRARGTTPSNPIVIEEAPKYKPAFPAMNKPPLTGPAAVEAILNKPGLAMPSKQEILAQLVKEKDIFPIIKSLIKLTAPATNTSDSAPTSGSPQPGLSTPPAPTPSRWGAEVYVEESGKGEKRSKVVGTHATGYPMKKRKLNRVPAGAVDWDAPYPFDRGEGPQEYRESWKAERGKQLITQLLNLIQSATKKAAMIKYLRRRGRRESKSEKGKAREGGGYRTNWEGPRVNKYYKAVTATYGLSPSDASSSRQSTPALDSDSRSVTPSTTTSARPSSSAATTPAPEQSQQSDSLDLLLSSIFAMSNIGQPSQGSAAASSSTASGLGDALGLGTDQSWLDDWMKTLNPTSPMDLGGSNALPSLDPSTNILSDLPMDFDFSSFDFPDLSNLPIAANSNPNPPFDVPANLPDNFNIDPDLLGLGPMHPLPPLDPGSMPNLASGSTSTTTTAASSSMTTGSTTPAEWDVSSMNMMDFFGSGFGVGSAMQGGRLGDVAIANADSTQGGINVEGGLDDPMWDAITGKVDILRTDGMGLGIVDVLEGQHGMQPLVGGLGEATQRDPQPFDLHVREALHAQVPAEAIEVVPEVPMRDPVPATFPLPVTVDAAPHKLASVAVPSQSAAGPYSA